MQEQNEQKEARETGKGRKKDFIWGGVSAALLLVLLVFGIWEYKDIPTSCNGESHTVYPWIGGNVAIAEVEARWQNSELSGNTYLQSHIGYHPVVTVRLADACQGSGLLKIVIKNEKMENQPNAANLAYVNGDFREVKKESGDGLLEASGKQATVSLLCGMGRNSRDARDFTMHAAARERKLWRVYVYGKPEGETEYVELGYTTIPATGEEI